MIKKKDSKLKRVLNLGLLTLLSSAVQLQPVTAQGELMDYRPNGKPGLNIFEPNKTSDTADFDGIRVKVGADFALQFQAIDHSTASNDTLAVLGDNFNLPTANFNIDVQLARGVRVSLVTYLASRHHPDAWVKGGYIQVDRLDFVKKGFLDGVMDIVTLRAGMDEINYGDAHFRRSDNARAIYNPFVGNYIMDAFTTEVFGEVYARKKGFLLMGGISNGNLNQSVVVGTKELMPSYYGKVGFDKEFSDDLRIRLTGSAYISPGYDNGTYLYNGDRTGARYYAVMQEADNLDFRSGRFNPGFTRYNAFQINPFVKWKGLEFFGVAEIVRGNLSAENTGGSYLQSGSELLYRFGSDNQFYIGARYNLVTGQDSTEADMRSIDRINAGGGWFMTDHIMVKAEYVHQRYGGAAWIDTRYEDGLFNGAVVEAVISF